MEYVLFYSEGADPAPYDPAEDDIAAWVADIEARGISEYGERLRPEQDATTVRVRRGELLVTDGPFTESKESIGGFDIIDAADLDEAIEIASRHPAARSGQAEVRPFMQWPGALPGSRVVPRDFVERPVVGRRYFMSVIVDPAARAEAATDAAADVSADVSAADAAADGSAAGDDDPEAWVQEMDARGARHFGEVLQPPADTTVVRRRGGRVLVSDGPFTEAKEWIAGFDLIEAHDLAEAVEIASKHPMARGGTIELRPLWPFDVEEDHVARDAREAADRDLRLEPPAAEVLAVLMGAAR